MSGNSDVNAATANAAGSGGVPVMRFALMTKPVEMRMWVEVVMGFRIGRNSDITD
jgi:hypothetical protein